MLTLIIILLASIAYLATGFVMSSKYYGRKTIEWEKGYATCKDCTLYYSKLDKKHHSYVHDGRGGYLFASVMLVPFWPLFGPFVGAVKGTKSIGAMYMKPIRDWEKEQETLIACREQYKDELRRLNKTDQEYQIYKDALVGIESQIVENVRK